MRHLLVSLRNKFDICRIILTPVKTVTQLDKKMNICVETVNKNSYYNISVDLYDVCSMKSRYFWNYGTGSYYKYFDRYTIVKKHIMAAVRYVRW